MNLSPVAALVALPIALGLGLGLHLLTAMAVKGVLRAFEPLAQGEPPIAEYARRVLATPEAGVLAVVGAVAAVGLAIWAALVTGFGLLWLVVLPALAGAVWLDLRAWERVVVSARHVWFQRGFGQPVQQVPVSRIADVGVDATEVDGFTLRHGRRGTVVRLWLRLVDKSLLVLPPTDTGAEEAVEHAANQVRARRAQWLAEGSLADAEARGSAAARAAAAQAADPAEAEMRLALQRLRQRALDPSGPGTTGPAPTGGPGTANPPAPRRST